MFLCGRERSKEKVNFVFVIKIVSALYSLLERKVYHSPNIYNQNFLKRLANFFFKLYLTLMKARKEMHGHNEMKGHRP